MRLLEQFLAEKIGLNCASLGHHAVALTAQQRMHTCGESGETYYRRVMESTEEQQALVESVVVPETWFFRDGEPFAYLSRFVVDHWLPRHPQELLRILSIPCATGEEPYSIAMALLSAGVAPERFRIEAIDISQNFLHQAERALYGHHSFRHSDLSFRDRYFDLVGNQYQLRASVRAQVHFVQGNIMQADLLRVSAPYPVIFCRNLLIYQHEAARQHILEVLDQWLAQDGHLFLGHAEMLSVLLRKYALVPHPGAFAFRKTYSANPPIKPAEVKVPAPIPAKPPPAPTGIACRASAPILNKETASARSLPPSNSSDPSSLVVAQQLADRGDLAGAALACEKILAADPANAQAFFLLGLVREAEGLIPQAMEQMHKAIYLKADFYEAILHLSLLKAGSGDLLNAERLRQRAARIHQQQRAPS